MEKCRAVQGRLNCSSPLLDNQHGVALKQGTLVLCTIQQLKAVVVLGSTHVSGCLPLQQLPLQALWL